MYFEYIGASAVCVAFLILVYGIGIGMFRGFELNQRNALTFSPLLLTTFFQLSLGLAGTVGILALLSIVHLLVPKVVLTVLFLAACAGYASAWRSRRLRLDPTARGFELWKGQMWADAVVLSALGMYLLLKSSHAPGHWDDISYHLPMAKLFVENQGLAVSEYLRFPFFPSNMQLLMAAGLMLSGDILAQMISTLPVFITCLGLMGFSQWIFGTSLWGSLASLLYLGTPVVGLTLGFAYVDLGLTLFCMAALFAVSVWHQQGGVAWRWLVLAGVFAGIAGGIKFHGLVVAALSGLVLLCVAKRWRPVLVFGSVCAVTASGWYLRSYWLSGDPVHPAGGGVFGHYLWSAADLASQQREQSSHGVPKNPLYFFSAFSHVKAYVIWPALVSIVLLWRGPHAWRVIWAVMAFYCVFWFFVSQVNRYLLPVLPVACLLFVAALQRLAFLLASARWVSRRAAQWLMACVFVALLGSNAERWSRAPTLQNQLQAQSAYVMAQKANQMATTLGTRMVNVGFENAHYYYQGELLGDWFGKVRFEEFAFYDQARWNMRPPAEVARRMQHLNSSLLLVHADQFKLNTAQYAEYFELLQTEGPGHLYARKNNAVR